MSDLAKRSASGAVLIAVAAAALWLGGIAFWLLAVIAGLLMMAEWSELHGTDARTKRVGQFAISVPLAIMCPLASGPSFLSLGLVAGAGFFVAAVTRRSALGWGAIYVGLPVLALLALRSIEIYGIFFAFWTMAVVWATDIGAYFAGRMIGGPKIAPAISPSKTWAGLIGGMIAAGGFSAALVYYYDFLPPSLALIAPILAIVAQAGDFYESWMKRRAGVKDSGTLLPGHGGVLDRLDGLVPVAPVTAAFVLLVYVPRIVYE